MTIDGLSNPGLPHSVASVIFIDLHFKLLSEFVLHLPALMHPAAEAVDDLHNASLCWHAPTLHLLHVRSMNSARTKPT
ncbi:hypothetical protein VTO73DRAFT_10622 [Trametes versicolor]